MVTSRITATISQELVLLRQGSARAHDWYRHGFLTPVGTCNTRPRSPTTSRPLKSRLVALTSFNTPFGRVVMRKKSSSTTFTSDKEEYPSSPHTRTETSWIFFPSFFARCVDFKVLNSCGYIQRSLRIHPVIPYQHPVWSLCRLGNVEGMQTLFSERQVSPFSIDPWGHSLLHVRIIHMILLHNI